MDEKNTKYSLLSVALGCWLISISMMFCALSSSLCKSDIAAGFLFILFGFLSLDQTRKWAGWGVGLVGVWLQLAPILFWTRSPMTYFNDTLVGIIAIILSFLLTRPEASVSESVVVESPRGWSYNPSAWSHRLPVVGLAMLCWFFARYMAAYQLGFISHIWDPFFPDGTLNVITSDVSRSFPVSDAGLGAVCYTIEAILGWQGSTRRWATMPWLVFSFAFLVIPVGVASITLIILQPVIVGAWCTWCLATALCMLFMIVLTAGEFAAVLQFLKEAKDKGESLWKVFWKGNPDALYGAVRPLDKRTRPWGVTFPRNLLLAAALGIWLLFAPNLIAMGTEMATSDYIQGPIIFSISIIAMAEVFRFLRWGLIALGAWLMLAPFLLLPISIWVVVTHCISGVLLILCAMPKGQIIERYGVWDRKSTR